MFRNTRVIHRWVGILTSVFMVAMAGTGLLLALKKKVAWIQPPSQKGTEIVAMAEVASIDAIARAVLAMEIEQLKSRDDFDRFELHVDKNIFKVTSKKGYQEVQVDAKTAEVLSVARRNDQMLEHIHDMSFFSGFMYDWLLPTVALSLFLLGLTGIYMFFTPVYRRWVFKRKGAAVKKE